MRTKLKTASRKHAPLIAVGACFAVAFIGIYVLNVEPWKAFVIAAAGLIAGIVFTLAWSEE